MHKLSAQMHCMLAIARADLLMRLRERRFWVVLGILMLATWSFFPPQEAQFATAAVNGQYRADYGSAWIGMLIGLLNSLLLSLAGFYVIRGTLTRDIDTRVWQLLVATTMTRRTYLLAKWCSHMAVLVLMAVLSLAVGLAIQWMRAEDRQYDLIEAVKPLLVIALPTLALTAAAALWFDMLPPLRRTLGNVIFFILWVTAISLGAADESHWKNPDNANAFAADVMGFEVFLHDLSRSVGPQLPEKQIDGFCLGCGMGAHKIPGRFVWHEWHPRTQDVMARLLVFILAIVAAAGAAPLLDWAAARAGSPVAASGKKIPPSRPLRLLTRLLEPLQASLLGRLFSAELLLILRQRRILWWLAMFGMCLMQVLAPPPLAAIGACLAWTLSLDVLSQAALRDELSGTRELVFTAPGATWRVLSARILTLLALLWGSTLPAMLRFGSAMPGMTLALLVIGLSLTVWALLFGTVLRNVRAFEIVFCLLAYHAFNGGAILNAGITPMETAIWHAVFVLPAGLLLIWRWPRLAQP